MKVISIPKNFAEMLTSFQVNPSWVFSQSWASIESRNRPNQEMGVLQGSGTSIPAQRVGIAAEWQK